MKLGIPGAPEVFSSHVGAGERVEGPLSGPLLNGYNCDLGTSWNNLPPRPPTHSRKPKIPPLETHFGGIKCYLIKE